MTNKVAVEIDQLNAVVTVGLLGVNTIGLELPLDVRSLISLHRGSKQYQSILISNSKIHAYDYLNYKNIQITHQLSNNKAQLLQNLVKDELIPLFDTAAGLADIPTDEDNRLYAILVIIQENISKALERCQE